MDILLVIMAIDILVMEMELLTMDLLTIGTRAIQEETPIITPIIPIVIVTIVTTVIAAPTLQGIPVALILTAQAVMVHSDPAALVAVAIEVAEVVAAEVAADDILVSIS